MNLEELRKVSFSGVLRLKDQSIIPSYNYGSFKALPNGHEITGYCTKCEENGFHMVSNKALSLMTYGTHTIDYMHYLGESLNMEDWHNEGVMFAFENPGKPWEKYGGLDSEDGMYRFCDDLPYKKSPMLNSWSWIGWDDKKLKEDFAYPKCFYHKNYGALILSLILLFKLRNAYVTNVIKCGTESGDNTKKFSDETINLCINNHLIKEIKALEPKLIFAFGKRTEKIIRKASPNSTVVYLPHPASRCKTSKLREFYSYTVLDELCKASIYEKGGKDYCEIIDLFENVKK